MVLNGIRVGNGKVPFNDIDMVYQTNENFFYKAGFLSTIELNDWVYGQYVYSTQKKKKWHAS